MTEDDRMSLSESELATPAPDLELDARVRSELRDGERLVWVGRPRLRRFAKQATPIVLFGIPWTAFALFWMAGASGLLFGGAKGGPPAAFNLFFPLFGAPFVLVGFGMLSAPIWMRRIAKRTAYAITDRRAIVLAARWNGAYEVRSYEPGDLRRMTRVQHADGGGDLVFDRQHFVAEPGDARPDPRPFGFLGIDRVREVEEIIRNALLEPAREGAAGESKPTV